MDVVVVQHTSTIDLCFRVFICIYCFFLNVCTGAVWGFTLSHQYIASVHHDKTIKLWNLFDKQNNCLVEKCQDNGPAHVLSHSSRIHSYDHVNSKQGDVVTICQGGLVYLWRNGINVKKCLLPSRSIMSFATGCPLYFCKYRAGLVVYNDDNYVYSARLEEDPGMTEEEKREGSKEAEVVAMEGAETVAMEEEKEVVAKEGAEKAGMEDKGEAGEKVEKVERTAERKGSVTANFIDEELNIIEQKEHEEEQQREQQRLQFKLKEKEKRNKAEEQKNVEVVEVVASMDDGATVDSHIVDQQAPMTEGPSEGEEEKADILEEKSPTAEAEPNAQCPVKE